MSYLRRLKEFGDRLTFALTIAFVIILSLEAWQYISSLRSRPAAGVFERVSLVQLLANPERYEGQKVQAAGFFVYTGQQPALFLNSEDAENGITQNSIRVALQPPAFKPDDLAPLDRKVVGVKGTFTARGPQIIAIEEVRSPPYASEPATVLQPAKTDAAP
ncbi:MAG TPA: hypothetical protein VEU06_10365 [Micropepsaceae bacterium]|nr:hypothetical protein [Micropepsaceae bacterium]